MEWGRERIVVVVVKEKRGKRGKVDLPLFAPVTR